MQIPTFEGGVIRSRDVSNGGMSKKPFGMGVPGAPRAPRAMREGFDGRVRKRNWSYHGGGMGSRSNMMGWRYDPGGYYRWKPSLNSRGRGRGFMNNARVGFSRCVEDKQLSMKVGCGGFGFDMWLIRCV